MVVLSRARVYSLIPESALSLEITTGEYKACTKLNSQRRRSLGDINGFPSEKGKIDSL
jgi:hypothetical protein